MRHEFRIKWTVIIFISFTCFVQSVDLKANKFFSKYCFDCHDSEMQEGKVNMEMPPADWTYARTGEFYESLIAALDTGYMPPAKKKKQPTDAERKEMIHFLENKLRENVKIGGGGLRRLTNIEYRNTIVSIFKMKYGLPDYFPPENTALGEMALSSKMQMSDVLLQSYYDVATEIANKVVPPLSPKRKIHIDTFKGSGEPLRLVSSVDLMAKSVKFEKNFGARYSGEYKVTLRVKPFRKKESFYKKPTNYVLQVLTLDEDNNVFQNYPKSQVKAEFSVKDGADWQVFSKTIRVEEGQTIVYRWKNGPVESGQDKKILVSINDKRFGNKKFWNAFNYVDKRGMSYKDLYLQVSMAYQKDLKPEKVKAYRKGRQLFATESNDFQKYLEGELSTIGPALDISMVKVEGPLKVYKSKRELTQEGITKKFLGDRKNRGNEEYMEDLVESLLSKAFRKPANPSQVAKYLQIGMHEAERSGRFEDGMNLVIRSVLTAPEFLFRYPEKPQLNSYDLASRLSYFLTMNPPDYKLYKLAASDSLIDNELLSKEVRRLIKSSKSDSFINHFIDKWLHIEKLEAIMPDSKLKRFTSKSRNAYRDEVRLFFKEILQKNLPLETFIDSKFTYVNKETAQSIYGIKGKFDYKMKKVDLSKDKVRGGLLTMPGILMATANGVETQPIIRGVWLLDNIFGIRLPHPPSTVPALEPDLSKAETVKQQIKAHQADPSCASCHKLIDPVGFALENFDAIGQWRSSYVTYEELNSADGIKKRYKQIAGNPIESFGKMPDGTEIEDVKALKKYLLKNIDMFSMRLAEKLMIFATGREMNYLEKQEIARVVKSIKAKGNGFQDLLVELVKSKVFKTR